LRVLPGARRHRSRLSRRLNCGPNKSLIVCRSTHWVNVGGSCPARPCPAGARLGACWRAWVCALTGQGPGGPYERRARLLRLPHPVERKSGTNKWYVYTFIAQRTIRSVKRPPGDPVRYSGLPSGRRISLL